MVGTDDIVTSGGYFHMGNVFFRKNQMATANSLYERVNNKLPVFIIKICSVLMGDRHLFIIATYLSNIVSVGLTVTFKES